MESHQHAFKLTINQRGRRILGDNSISLTSFFYPLEENHFCHSFCPSLRFGQMYSAKKIQRQEWSYMLFRVMEKSRKCWMNIKRNAATAQNTKN